MRLKLLIVFLLFPLAISASTLNRLDSLQAAVYDMFSLNRAGDNLLADSVLNPIINNAIQQVSSDFDAVIKLDSIECSDGVTRYSLDTTFRKLLWCLRWQEKDSTQFPIEVVPYNTVYERAQATKALPKPVDDPQYVYTSGKTLFLHPVPEYTDTLWIGYAAIARKLTADADTTDILEPFRYLIVLHAAMQVADDLDMDTKATKFEKRYDKILLKYKGVTE